MLETPSSSLGQWLHFNDILVDEFTIGDTALEAECSYKAKPGVLGLAFLELMVGLQSEVLVSYMYVQLCSPRANCMFIVHNLPFLHPV